MKFRIVNIGVSYLVQWEIDGKWEYIKYKDIPKKTTIHSILEYLAVIGFGRKWFPLMYHENNDQYKDCLIFANEMLASTFLGACKVWFRIDTKDFNL